MANLAGILSESIDETNLLILTFDLVPFDAAETQTELRESRQSDLCSQCSVLSFYVAIEKVLKKRTKVKLVYGNEADMVALVAQTTSNS